MEVELGLRWVLYNVFSKQSCELKRQAKILLHNWIGNISDKILTFQSTMATLISCRSTCCNETGTTENVGLMHTKLYFTKQ